MIAVRNLLETRGPFAAGERTPWLTLLGFVLVAGPLYGTVMGSYSGSMTQASFSASKVPLLLATTSLLCLPNFFVINTVLGLRDDFSAAMRGLLASQATFAIVLLSLAPILAFAYVSGIDYAGAISFNGVLFLVASLSAQVTLARHYRPLIERDPRHRIGLAAWMVLYVFIAIQLAWLLRPFIGHPNMPASFFRADAFESNAYVKVVTAVRQALGL